MKQWNTCSELCEWHYLSIISTFNVNSHLYIFLTQTLYPPTLERHYSRNSQRKTLVYWLLHFCSTFRTIFKQSIILQISQWFQNLEESWRIDLSQFESRRCGVLKLNTDLIEQQFASASDFEGRVHCLGKKCRFQKLGTFMELRRYSL